MYERFSDIITRFGLLLGAFFSPLVPLLATVGVAILIDTLAGRWAAGYKAKKDGFQYRDVVTSKKTRQGVVEKSVSYCLVVIFFYMLDLYVINEVTIDYVPWEFISTKIVVIFLCWIEYDSIDEKYYRVKGYRIKDKFHDFTDDIKNFFRKLFKFKDFFSGNE